MQTASRPTENSVAGPVKPPALPDNDIQKFGVYRLVGGGLIFIGLTAGIFWYQFSDIPLGHRPSIWNQLQWGYLFWLLFFLPVETFAAGLRIWVISRALQPGVSLWTCLKAEWANLGLAMLTPSQTGGGVGQIYMLSRGGMKLTTALTVSLISFLGSMVVLLFIGIYSLLIAKVNHLLVFFQGALLVFLLVFAVVIFAVCWPASLGFVISGICSGTRNICGKKRSGKRFGLPQNCRIRRLTDQLHRFSQKLIDLCYMHQANMRRFFRLNGCSFIWVCLLSLVFMLSRAVMAFLCLRFLGIQAAALGDVLETQLSLIFLIYFAPTPGSSGLAEGASMLMMHGAVPAGFAPYYNLLWRCSTLYLPAIAGLLFLLRAILQDARIAIRR
ncbi:MAG: lysylphosphatidylglycerol synthase transmembrane domain-containing protein [Desulfobacterales bacterium]